MSRQLIYRISSLINRIENAFPQLFGKGFPPESLCIAGMPSTQPWGKVGSAQPASRFSLKDLIGDGFLWAVPKHRRSIEKKLSRRFGLPEFNWKMLTAKTNLRMCNQCGHDHEAGVLCPHCYQKVRAETEQMQETIQQQLGLNPVEQEVVVLYEGEKSEQPSEFLNGKRIVEMKKARPTWFSKNLMQKTTQPAAVTKEVKPSDLG